MHIHRALQALPNAAHFALATFSIDAFRKAIAPGSTFTLITQNVDGLSRRAWDEVVSKAGLMNQDTDEHPPMLEMHGRLFDVLCTSRTCRHRQLDFSSPICPALAGTEELVEAGSVETDVPLDQLPRCSKCGALARPGVVWFGEQPHYLNDIDTLVDRAELCLVLGTSSTVSIYMRHVVRELMICRYIPPPATRRTCRLMEGRLRSLILTEVKETMMQTICS